MKNDASSWLQQKDLTAKVGFLLQTLNWAFRYVWPISPRLISIQIGLTLLLGLLPAGQALIARNLVNAITDSLSLHTSFEQTILPWLVASVAITLFQIALEFLRDYCSYSLKNRLSLVAVTHLLTHAARLEIAEFDNPEHYDKRDRAQRQSEVHLYNVIQGTVEWLTNIFQLASIIAVLLAIAPVATVVLLPVAIPYFVYMWRQSENKYQFQFTNTTKRRWRDYFVTLLLSPKTQPELRVFGLAPHLIDRYQKSMREMIQEEQSIHIRMLGAGRLFTAIYSFIFHGLWGWIAWRVFQGFLTLGDFVIYGRAALQMQAAIRQINDGLSQLLQETLYVSDLRAFLNLTPRSDTQATPHRLASPIQGRIEFQDVHFKYPFTNDEVLKGVTFTVEPGEIVALVGRNGAGKTTIVKLLSGLYAVDSGAIKLDSNDIQDLAKEDVQAQISFLMQEFNRYEGTVMENIAYSNWHQLLHDAEQVELIAKRAGIDKMIQSLPNKYDTRLGRMFGEIELSGGQWQHIALARAFARNSPIIILDEPTAHLDVEVEAAFFKQMRELARGRTALLISHRFSTVQLADRIIVLSKGRVVEQGTHYELMKINGTYAYLYRLHKVHEPGLDS